MSIRKVNGLEGHFSIVPNAMVNDSLSWEAIGMLAYLTSKPDNWKVSVQQLVNQSAKSDFPSGRDKTYRILKELQDANYVKRENDRKNGKFAGKNYIVSPTKLTEVTGESDPPRPDKPVAVKKDESNPPLTAEPTLQRKESNKERKKQIDEKKSSPDSKPNTLQKVKSIKTDQQKGTRTDYPQEFDEFFKAFPKTNGSKKETLREWKSLNTNEKQLLTQSVNRYKSHLADRPWKQAMSPARYIRGEHYLVYEAVEDPQKDTEKISIKGRGFEPEALVELCTAYFRTAKRWSFENMLGPAPDRENTLIPESLILEARKIADKNA